MGRYYSRNGTGVVPTAAAGGGVYDDTPANFGTGQIITYANGTDGNFEVPNGITKIRVTCMGKGGKGGAGLGKGGGGGGGGGFILKIYTVTSGQVFALSNNSGEAKFDTGGAGEIIAHKGNNGTDGDASNGTGGSGGSFTSSGGANETDYFGYLGGDGGNADTTAGGGGGGNGLCSFVFDRSKVPHGTAGDHGTSSDGGGGGGIYGSSNAGITTASGFLLNPIPSSSPLSRYFYNSTANDEPGVVHSDDGGIGGAYAGGNGGTAGVGGLGGLGAGAGGSYLIGTDTDASNGGNASIIIEY